MRIDQVRDQSARPNVAIETIVSVTCHHENLKVVTVSLKSSLESYLLTPALTASRRSDGLLWLVAWSPEASRSGFVSQRRA
jgi:hypothetical protein